MESQARKRKTEGRGVDSRSKPSQSLALDRKGNHDPALFDKAAGHDCHSLTPLILPSILEKFWEFMVIKIKIVNMSARLFRCMSINDSGLDILEDSVPLSDKQEMRVQMLCLLKAIKGRSLPVSRAWSMPLKSHPALSRIRRCVLGIQRTFSMFSCVVSMLIRLLLRVASIWHLSTLRPTVFIVFTRQKFRTVD